MRGIVAALLLTSAGGFATRRTLLRLSVQSRGVPDSAAPPAPSLRSDVASFKVMDVVESAQALEAEGHRVYHLEVGQPSTGAPAAVKRAAARALDTEKLGYTQSKGIPELREAIIKHYYEVGGIPEGSLDPERLVITTGSSGGFLLAFAACFDKDDHVAVGSTCYPCYRNILESMDCHPAIIQLNKEFKLTATQLRAEVERRKDAGLPPLKGVIQSSPSNPTGSTLTPAEVEEMCAFCAAEGMWFLSDEIYHGINFGEQAASALRFPQYADNVMVLNSFSKYFSMTGWRLGWMVLPEGLVDSVYRLQQNMFINAPTLSQLAAVECFSEESIDELEGHVARYTENREIVMSTLERLEIPISPCNGAFYVYADLGDLAGDVAQGLGAEVLCETFLREKKVAITPGTDFEDPASGMGFKRIRFSFPGATEDVREAMKRFEEWWPSWLERCA